MEKSKQQKNKVRFVVVREFSGEKSMREAFEQADRAPDLRTLRGMASSAGNGRKSCVKTVDSGTGTWYYNGIVSLFIEGERYEQEKTSL